MSKEIVSLETRQVQARALLVDNMKNILEMVNRDETKANNFKNAILNMLTDSNLSDCSVESIVKNGLNIIQLGLDPNKAYGQAYVVPFGSKDSTTGVKQAQLQIGYKGWIALGYRNGWVFELECVYSCDKFSIKFTDLKKKITYEPKYEARNSENPDWVFENLKGIIVRAEDRKSTGHVFAEFVPKAKLEKLRLKSQTQNNSDGITKKSQRGFDLVWGEWAEEMYKAKALKYVVTRLPITENLQTAVIMENAVYEGKDNSEYIDAVVENENTGFNEPSLSQQVIDLAKEKNVDLNMVLQAYGKTDISQMSNQDLINAKKRLEITEAKGAA